MRFSLVFSIEDWFTRVAVQNALSAVRALRRSKQPTKFQKIKFQEDKTDITQKFSTTNSHETMLIKQSSDNKVPPLEKSAGKSMEKFAF